METFERAIYLNRLYDFYEQLLTDKQREIFVYYYQEDLSYQEIADILKISRSAVYDTLHRSILSLEDFEAKLGIASTYQKLFDELYALADARVDQILKTFEKGEQ